MEQTLRRKLRHCNYLYSEIASAYHEASVKLGVSHSVLTILYTLLGSSGRHPLGDICRCSGLSRQTANSALRKLEQEGYLYLEAIDGKSKLVCLTPSGEALAEQTVGRLADMEDRIYADWSREDLDRLLELTGRFEAALKEQVDRL